MEIGSAGGSGEVALPYYIGEMFWPGATEAAAISALQRLRDSCERLAATGVQVRFLGGTFVIADEDLLCRFEGTVEAVRAAHDHAGLEFDRLLPTREIGPRPAT